MPATGVGASQSVFGELKLSEKLSTDLASMRNKVYELTELLESTAYDRDEYKARMKQLQKKCEK